ncbi:uncharacterized protein V1510DRAFT_423799 [Dipodascopsis tothii]|uniref:uncharacterized protein n=1 Tax=Dipodascopsis tothii TaxID=44089 RepID=UPI0034CD64DB
MLRLWAQARPVAGRLWPALRPTAAAVRGKATKIDEVVRHANKWTLEEPAPARPAELDTVPEDWRADSRLPQWKRQQYAVKEKIGGQAWSPRKKLSPDAIQGIRAFKKQFPEYTAGDLAAYFHVSPEAMRRILKSNWTPRTAAESQKVQERWRRRGERIVDRWTREGRPGFKQ